MTEWRIAGPYFEACNCDAICSCRMVDGRPGSRAQYRLCQFAIGWSVTEGRHGDTDLSDRHIAMVGYWDEDEAGAPWRVGVYVDAGASDEQRELLGRIVTGREGGTPRKQYAGAISEVVFVAPAAIEIGHDSGRQHIQVDGHVEVKARGRYDTSSTVSCGVPGHDRGGYEVVSSVLDVKAGPFEFSYQGRCGFVASFDYRSD
jgi:hypothetical protein